jgi:hypothetical protein
LSTAEAQRAYRKAHPERWAEGNRLWKYGLSKEAFTVLLAVANGSCMICKQPTTTFQVDHDHETKQVRGLLCGSCNKGLSNFGDDPERLIAAATYLKGRPL